MKIYKNSKNVRIWGLQGGYFEDVNVYVRCYSNCIVVKDLTNALKAGKTCTTYHIGNDEQEVLEIVRDYGTVYNLVTNIDQVRVKTIKREEKGVRTFSPFVRPKPIKRPKKWTLNHVWKAILAGQIIHGECRGYYTDDYAGDAQNDFGRGAINLLSLAEDIVKSPSGWRVFEIEEKDGIIKLAVNCYHFNNNHIYFDVNAREQHLQKIEYQEDVEKKAEEALKKWEEEREERQKEYEKWKQKRQQRRELVVNNVIWHDLPEHKQFRLPAKWANLNKNDTLNDYRELVLQGDYTTQDILITRKVIFTDIKALRAYNHILMDEFDFIRGTGGTRTDDPRIRSIDDYFRLSESERKTIEWYRVGIAVYLKHNDNDNLQYVIDAQGYDYARYVGLVDKQAREAAQ